MTLLFTKKKKKKKTPFCVPVKAENRLVGDDGIMTVAVRVTGAYTTHKLYFCTNSWRKTKRQYNLTVHRKGWGYYRQGLLCLSPLKKLGEGTWTIIQLHGTCIHASIPRTVMAHCIASVLSLSRAQGKAHNLSPALSGPFSIVRNL